MKTNNSAYVRGIRLFKKRVPGRFVVGLEPSFNYNIVVAYLAAILLQTAVCSNERFRDRCAKNKADCSFDRAVDANEQNHE